MGEIRGDAPAMGCCRGEGRGERVGELGVELELTDPEDVLRSRGRPSSPSASLDCFTVGGVVVAKGSSFIPTCKLAAGGPPVVDLPLPAVQLRQSRVRAVSGTCSVGKEEDAGRRIR